MPAEQLRLKLRGDPADYADAVRELLLEGVEFDLNHGEVHRYAEGSGIFAAVLLTIWNAPKKLEELRRMFSKLVLRPVEVEWGDLRIKVADRQDFETVLEALKSAKAFEATLKTESPKLEPPKDVQP